MNLKISYDHYIVINDGQVTGSNLPGNVSFDHETLTLSLGAPITLHVIVILTHDYTLHYHVGAHTKAEVIETRIMNADATLTRDFAVELLVMQEWKWATLNYQKRRSMPIIIII